MFTSKSITCISYFRVDVVEGVELVLEKYDAVFRHVLFHQRPRGIEPAATRQQQWQFSRPAAVSRPVAVSYT